MSEDVGLYNEVKTTPVKTECVEQVFGNEPFIGFLPSVTTHSEADIGSKIGYVSISPDAGRTIENQTIGKKVVFGGPEPGDIYGDKDQKGSLFNTSIKLQLDSYGNLRLIGFKEYTPQMLDREIKLTNLLREEGLPTDQISSVFLIRNLPDRYGKFYPMDRWKKLALKRYSEENDDPNKIDQAKNWLEKNDFAIELRNLQVAERIRTLTYCKNADELKRALFPVMKWVNVATKTKGGGLIKGTPAPKPFTLDNDGVQRFLFEWVPTQMGVYLAKMRGRFVHRNGGAQNWSLASTLYDKDTMLAKELGDTITLQQHSHDIVSALGCFDELFDHTSESFISKHFTHKDLIKAKGNILKSYTDYHTERSIKVNFKKQLLSTYKYFNGRTHKSVELKPQDWEYMESIGVNIKE